jgi:uncharacterized protein YjeT (DUF2065 family)
MWDLAVAVGLMLAIEGILFAAFPVGAKQAMASVQETPDHVLRAIGIVCAVAGVLLVWFVRG